MQDRKTSPQVTGSVEFFAWIDTDNKSKRDPSVNAILKGANVGHASLRIRIPLEEIDQNPELSEKMEGFREELGENAEKVFKDDKEVTLRVNGKPKRVHCLEIYFSYWPGEGEVKYKLNTYDSDMLSEWSGRKSPPIDVARARLAFGMESDEEVREYAKTLITPTRRSVFNPIRFIPQTEYKSVYSGPKSIFHGFDGQGTLKDIKLLIEKLDNQNLKKKDFELRLQLLEQNIRENGWTNDALERTQDLLEKFIGYLKMHENENQEYSEIIEKLNEHILSIPSKDYRTIGVEADYFTTLEADNFDISKAIEGMELMLEKEWTFTNWNCSSSVLYIILNALKAELKEDPDIVFYLNKLSGEKPPILTPLKVHIIVRKIQEKIVAVKMAHASESERQQYRDIKKINAHHEDHPLENVIALIQYKMNHLGEGTRPVEDEILDKIDELNLDDLKLVQQYLSSIKNENVELVEFLKAKIDREEYRKKYYGDEEIFSPVNAKNKEEEMKGDKGKEKEKEKEKEIEREERPFSHHETTIDAKEYSKKVYGDGEYEEKEVKKEKEIEREENPFSHHETAIDAREYSKKVYGIDEKKEKGKEKEKEIEREREASPFSHHEAAINAKEYSKTVYGIAEKKEKGKEKEKEKEKGADTNVHTDKEQLVPSHTNQTSSSQNPQAQSNIKSPSEARAFWRVRESQSRIQPVSNPRSSNNSRPTGTLVSSRMSIFNQKAETENDNKHAKKTPAVPTTHKKNI